MSDQNKMLARIAELEAQLSKAQSSKTSIRLSDSGYVEVYGLPGKGRFSLSGTAETWKALFDKQTEIVQFIAANAMSIGNLQAKYQANRASIKAVG